MKYKPRLKYRLSSPLEIRNWTVFAGVALTLFGCMMIWRTTRHTPDEIAQSESYEKLYLAPDTYLVNAVQKDSVHGWSIRSEMVYYATVFFAEKGKPLVIDLYDPAYARLPWLYTGFYTLMTLLLIPVFVYMYRFVCGILPGDPFEKENIRNLARAGFALTLVSFFYFCGSITLNLILSMVYQISADHAHTRYESFLLIFLIGMAGMVIQLLVRLALKGNEIQNEQNLTI